MDAAVAGLIGTAIGAASGLLGAIITVGWNFRLQSRKERKSIASAFYGEIGALLEIVERRKYIQGIEASLTSIGAEFRSPYSFKITRSYFNVYEKNIDKIGLLPNPLPEKVVLLYTIAFSILEDIDSLNKEDFNQWDDSEAKYFLRELLNLFNEAILVGGQVQDLIRKKRLLSN
jgi:hypothetical protein